jgi:hypothetical protein
MPKVLKKALSFIIINIMMAPNAIAAVILDWNQAIKF